MAAPSRKDAVQAHRQRLREKGVGRYEVRGLEQDKELVRAIARKLAEGGPAAADLRSAVTGRLRPDLNEKGAIWRAFRASPLVGAELDLARVEEPPRDVEF